MIQVTFNELPGDILSYSQINPDIRVVCRQYPVTETVRLGLHDYLRRYDRRAGLHATVKSWKSYRKNQFRLK